MRGHKRRYLGAILAVGFATLFSLSTPLVLRFLIDSVIGNEPLQMPHWLLSVFVAVGGKSKWAQHLWLGGLLIVMLTALRGTFLYLKGKWSALASESMAKRMRERLFDHLQHLTYEYHVKARTGDLIQRCTSDVETVRRFIAVQFIEVGRAIFLLGAVLPIMLSLNVRMTVISLFVVPIVFTFAVIFFSKVRRAFQLSDEAEGELSTILQENLTGVRVVRAFARQVYEMDKFDHYNARFRDLTYRLIWLLAWYWGTSDLICLAQIGAVIVLGAFLAAQGTISLGTYFVFASYVGMLLWPVRQMGRILTDMGKMLVSLGRIKEILDTPVEDVLAEGSKPPILGEIEFSNVTFSYGGDRSVLRDVSFHIPRGQTVAILGATGSGKSSLVHLLPALYDYDRGSIKIDGTELREINREWLRQHIGIVLQEPFLFSKSVRDNIGLAKTEAEEEEIMEAAQTAAIHDVILQFEEGYDTPVGERGVTLSGGQKQRVAMARILIENYPILIFDDSLSAVDTETDAAIQKALKARSHRSTTFIISHRITTLSEADIILVFDDGMLVQSGKHDDLINQPGLYQRIWELQGSLAREMTGATGGKMIRGSASKKGR